MMATKPTTSLRDRRISGGDSTSPPAAEKPAPKYLKSKVVSSSESPTRRVPVANAITASATSKTPSARRLQRPWKPAAYTPKPSSSSMLHGDKAAQTVSGTARTNLFPKAKSTRPTLLKKKEAAPVTVAAISDVKVSSDHDAVTAFEWPVKGQLWKNEPKIVEESRFISSLVEEVDHIEEQKSGEPEPVVLEEVVVASSPVEKRDEEEKLEQEDAVVTVVTPTPEVKKKDTPLSNEVIEEAKSKLMGTRKNKVLALVGAFETFISLQESEGQQIQKAFQVQHELQIPQDQQAEKSFENHKNQLGVENQQNQEARRLRMLSN